MPDYPCMYVYVYVCVPTSTFNIPLLFLTVWITVYYLKSCNSPLASLMYRAHADHLSPYLSFMVTPCKQLCLRSILFSISICWKACYSSYMSCLCPAHSFSVAIPSIENSLPIHARNFRSETVFHSKLKTWPFRCFNGHPASMCTSEFRKESIIKL